MDEQKKRVLWMDIAKAIGILVVLLVHTGRGFGPLTYFGGMFYMPVFFILAGMTFRYREEESFGTFLKKKARRLLVPYFGYNLFLFLFFFVKNRDWFPLLGILYSRNCLFKMNIGNNLYFMQILNAPTWFLTGLFASLAIYWLLHRAAKGDKKRLVLLTGLLLVIAIFYHYLSPVLLPWSLDCALYAAGFLLFGEVLWEKRTVEGLCQKPWYLALTVAIFVGLSYLNGSVNMSVADYGRSMVLYLIVGCTGSLLVLELSLFVEKHCRHLAAGLAFVGRHTLPILCLHLFAYSVIGTVMGLLGNLWMQSGLGMLAGITVMK